MKTTITLLYLLFFSSVLLSQNNNIQWDWANVFGEKGIANQVLVDENNDIIVSGIYEDTLIIENDTIIAWQSGASKGVFLAKFDNGGNLIWLEDVFYIYSGGWEKSPIQMLKLDQDNNIRAVVQNYIILTYSGVDGSFVYEYEMPKDSVNYSSRITDLEFDKQNHMILYTFETDFVNTRAKIFKFDYNYDTLWLKSFQVSPGMYGNAQNYYIFHESFDLDVDTSGNIYALGSTYSDYDPYIFGNNIVATIDSANASLYQLKYNSFITKIDTSGQFLWFNTIFPNQHQVGLYNVGVSSQNTMFLSGFQFHKYNGEDTLVMENDTIYLDSTFQNQIILLNYDLDGDYKWLKNYPLHSKSLISDTIMQNMLYQQEIVVTDSANVYLKANFPGSIIFGNDTLVEDISFYMLDSIFMGYVDFDSLYYYYSYPDDQFIAKLDSNGNAIWGKYLGNSGSLNYRGIDVESRGFWIDQDDDIIYLVGSYEDPFSGQKAGTNNAIMQIFVGKERGTSGLAVNELVQLNESIFVFPNPSDGIYEVQLNEELIGSTFQIYNVQGQAMKSGTFQSSKSILDLSSYNTGMYFLKTINGTVKLIKK